MTIEHKQRFQEIALLLKQAAVETAPDAVHVTIAVSMDGPVGNQMAEVRIGKANGGGWESAGFPVNKKIES